MTKTTKQLVERTDSYPDDFQQLLLDYLVDYRGYEQDTLPKIVRVKVLPIHQHFGDLLDAITEDWVTFDFERALEFSSAMEAGDQFPPFVTNHGKLLDGYHRLFALKRLEIETYRTIEL